MTRVVSADGGGGNARSIDERESRWSMRKCESADQPDGNIMIKALSGARSS